MSYLQAVIKESLRLHGVTGMVLERMAPDGGITLADTFFEGVSKSFHHAPLQEKKKKINNHRGFFFFFFNFSSRLHH